MSTTPATPTYPTPHTTSPADAATPPADAGPSLDWDRPARLLVEGRLIRGAYHDVRDGQDCYCLITAVWPEGLEKGDTLRGFCPYIPHWVHAALIVFDDETVLEAWSDLMEVLTESMREWGSLSDTDWSDVWTKINARMGVGVPSSHQSTYNLHLAVFKERYPDRVTTYFQDADHDRAALWGEMVLAFVAAVDDVKGGGK